MFETHQVVPGCLKTQESSISPDVGPIQEGSQTHWGCWPQRLPRAGGSPTAEELLLLMVVHLLLLILWPSLPSCHHKNQALTWAGVYSWGIARAQAARRARQMVERNILSQVLSILLEESTATGLPQLLTGFYRLQPLC